MPKGAGSIEKVWISKEYRIRYPIPMNETVQIITNQPGPMDSTVPAPTPPFSVVRYLRQFALRVVVYLVMYLLISIATIGPFYWQWFESVYMHGPRWIQKFYAPLLWLCDHCSWLSWIVNEYVNWWIG